MWLTLDEQARTTESLIEMSCDAQREVDAVSLFTGRRGDAIMTNAVISRARQKEVRTCFKILLRGFNDNLR